jgi:hypothetical protein
MNRTLRVQAMEEITTATPVNQTPAGKYYLTFPADFLELQHIEAGGQSLEYVNSSQMATESETGYTIANELFLFWQTDEVDIYYYKSIPALTDAAPTNFFTNAAYDALLYLSLDHAGAYVGEQNNYRQMGVERLTEVQQADNRSSMSGAPLVQRG